MSDKINLSSLITHRSSLVTSFLSSRHHQADLFLRCLLRVNFADELAVVDDEQAVGERRDLFEFGGDEEYGAAVVPELDELAVYELYRPDVNAARRLRDEEQLWPKLEL